MRSERLRIDLVSAIEGAGHALHAPRNAGVADRHFAQRVLETLKYVIYKVLRDGGADRAERAQASQDQPGMQSHHLKAAIEVVRDGKVLKQRGVARRRHDLAVNLVDQNAVGAPGAPAGEDHRRLAFPRGHGLGIPARSSKSKRCEAAEGSNAPEFEYAVSRPSPRRA